MVVGMQEVIDIENKFGTGTIPLFLLTDMTYQLPGQSPHRLKRGSEIEGAFAARLFEAGESTINLVFNEKLFLGLSRLNPLKYRLPFKTISYVELDKTLHALEKINANSRRKREVICLDEVYKKDNYDISILIPYGVRLDLTTWNSVKIKIDRKRRFPIRFNELGIIVFVDLRAEGPDYLQRFYRNSDLVTSLVGHRHDAKTVIAPDFISEYDVYTVDEPDKLLQVYMENSIRLIIVGDVLSEEYKKALISVRNYDKFARFIVATNIDQKDLDVFLSQVKQSYYHDNYDIDDYL